jgi:hypothetical protein
MFFSFFLYYYNDQNLLINTMPNGFYSLGPANQIFARPHPIKDLATDLISQPSVVVTLGCWVEERALSGLEGLASNPKEQFEMVSLGSWNATTSFITRVPTQSKVVPYVLVLENLSFPISQANPKFHGQ